MISYSNIEEENPKKVEPGKGDWTGFSSSQGWL